MRKTLIQQEVSRAQRYDHCQRQKGTKMAWDTRCIRCVVYVSTSAGRVAVEYYNNHMLSPRLISCPPKLDNVTVSLGTIVVETAHAVVKW